jgi:hypothetical protein
MVCKRCDRQESRTPKAHYCEECFKLIRSETHRRSHLNNKDKRNKLSSEYKCKNKCKISEYNKRYNEENKEILREKRKIKRNINRNKLNKDSVEWRSKNKDKVSEYNKKHTPLYNKKYPWRKAIRTILRNTLKRIGSEKESYTEEISGYSAIDLKNHLEFLFSEGMTWDNYGDWHIDHILPVSHFDENTPVSVINSLSNLQPLWKFDNLSKGKKVIIKI